MMKEKRLKEWLFDKVATMENVSTVDPGPEEEARHDKLLKEQYGEILGFLEKHKAYVVLGVQETGGTPMQVHPDEDLQATCLVRGEGYFLYYMISTLLAQLEPWLQRELALGLGEELALEEELVKMKPQGEA